MGMDAWQDLLQRVWNLEQGGGGGGGPLVVSDPTYCLASATLTPTDNTLFVQPPYIVEGDLVTVDGDGNVFAAADGVYAIFVDNVISSNGDNTNETLVAVATETELLSCSALLAPTSYEEAPIFYSSSSTLFGYYAAAQEVSTPPGITMAYDDASVLGTFEYTGYLIIVKLSTS